MRSDWNTERSYTVKGQRISAVTISNGIVFKDHDRMIDGFIPWAKNPDYSDDLKKVVMFCYDLGNYYSVYFNQEALAAYKLIGDYRPA